jgi:prepilin-type N-terminal cleavage/methylation domain-containing protein
MLIFSHPFHFSGRKLFPKRPRGFTLVELLMVIGIMSMLTAALVFQHRRFDSSTLLRSLAYNVALSVRQAQVYGTSVRQFGSSFSYSYGVYFSAGNYYYLFADVDNDKVRKADGTEDVQRFTIGTGYSIAKFCGTVVSGGTPGSHCSTDASPITSLTVYFRRPNPDALFSSSASSEVYSDVYIQLLGPTGGTDTRGVTVTSTGQISVGALGS